MSTTETATATVPARAAHHRRYLMCKPSHFTVNYSINPWMEPANPTDTAKAVAQWQKLHDLYLELGPRGRADRAARRATRTWSTPPTAAS